ncbi:hypothetical protein MRY87_10765 [bacterium]|nr:hypothetical protein [bacterium]
MSLPSSDTETFSARSLLLIATGAFLLSCAALIPVSLSRFVAADEGFYLLAGRLVSEGRLPYFSFFYPQMPLLPLIHGAWISLLGADWLTARLITVCFACGTIALCVTSVAAQKRSLVCGLLALLLFLTNSLVLTWFTVAKTYPFASLPLMGSIVCLLLALREREDEFIAGKTALLAGAGLLLGIAIGIRLFYAGLLPIFLWYIGTSRNVQPRFVFAFLIGGAVSGLPHLIFLSDPAAYWFNNLGYHLVRNHRPESIDAASKWRIFRIVTGMHSSFRVDGLASAALLWINLVIAGVALWKKQLPPFPTAAGLVLFGLYFVPSPIHVQYFSTCIPLFILGIGSTSFSARRMTITILVGLSMLSLWSTPETVKRITESGRGLKGLTQESKEIFTLQTLEEISALLNHEFREGQTVASQWPGFLFATHLSPVLGLENQFWVRMEGKVSEQEISRYHLMNREMMRALPDRRDIDGVIIETEKLKRYFPSLFHNLSGYRTLPAPDGMMVLTRRQNEGETNIP